MDSIGAPLMCPTCGAEVDVIDAGEGTKWMVSHRMSADADATNMAVAIKLALRYLPPPETDNDTNRAIATGALQGAISAHDRRLFMEGRS